MRAIKYGVLETTTQALTKVGVSLSKANEKLEELQQFNPAGNYKVVYKWFSI